MSHNNVIIIGSGFGGLSTACYLAKAGYKVTVLEKNAWAGGRAQVWEKDGFRFDMGPSWYWMKEIFEQFFADFGHKREDFYRIDRLRNSYKIFFGNSLWNEHNNVVTVPSHFEDLQTLFEQYEPGAGEKLRHFLANSKRKYDIALGSLIYQNIDSIFDVLKPEVIKNILNLDIHKSYHDVVKKYFKHPYLQKICEFPVVFLGGEAKSIPGVYTLMNYVDMIGGSWYPEGGFSKVAESMYTVAKNLGVTFVFNEEVTSIETQNKQITGVTTIKNTYSADIVVANGDYEFVEQHLLKERDKTYSPTYWSKRTLAPSCLNFYLGINKKLPNLEHHTFFFDTNWEEHFQETYSQPQWPQNPLFYIHMASHSDQSVAPKDCETLFILVPCAPGLEDTTEIRTRIRTQVISRIEELTGETIKDNIVVEKSYSIAEFSADYHAYKGNGFGLAQTLFQTAFFRPKNQSNKVRGLFYAGQFTTPGTGTMMALISGKSVTEKIKKIFLLS